MIDPRNPDFENTPVSPRRPRFTYEPADSAAAPVVSIVTPYYNTGGLFHETARSIFGQSLQQWEWIIVNDGSTDAEALAVLDEYRGRDPRVRVIDHEVNRGPGAARNTGYLAARTGYIFQLDSDDLFEPTALEKMVWFLESYPEYAFVRGYTVGFEIRPHLWARGFDEMAGFLHDNLATIHAMLRRSVFEKVGGFDSSIRDGMEDWEFWLRCADHGLWGADIPEFLDWYRRRSNHGDRWADLATVARREEFRQRLKERFPRLYSGGFPRIERRPHMPFETVRRELPFANVLRKSPPRLLLIIPWMVMGGADKFNLDLIEQLTRRGWEVTVAATLRAEHGWLPRFTRLTPDVFAMCNFLRPVDQPIFLRYLIESRQPDVVMVSNSELGYQLLPYLRAHCPGPAFVDYCHMEEEYWKDGGYPRYAVGCQDLLDLNIVSSQHLKNWMVNRGADPSRIEVAYINVDPQVWAPDSQARRRVRARHRIAAQEPVILYAGRLCPQKRPQIFASVVHELARQELDFVALVAGDGEDRPALERYLTQHRLEGRVRMLGEVSPEAIRGLMAAADVFFLPSRWEGIALTIYEAMATGLAVVGADVGGQRELVTPECGILVPRGDASQEIAGYVEQLRRVLTDPALRARMGRAARDRICTHFRLQAMGDRMVELLEKARCLRAESPRPAISRGYGYETAVQAIEYVRITECLDVLWQANEGRVARADRAHGDAEAEAITADVSGRHEPYDRMLAVAQLTHIENSRSWRLVQRLKRNPLYRVTARLRFGPGWDAVDPGEDPRVRLERIRNSNAYRMIQAIKRTPFYRWYARRKYGLPPGI